MATIETRPEPSWEPAPTTGRCGPWRDVPKIKFPFVIIGSVRGFAALRPYRCPECGAEV